MAPETARSQWTEQVANPECPEVRLALWLVRLDAVAAGELDLTSLDDRERHQAERLPSRDRTGYLATHVLLRRLLAERLACRPAEVTFAREPCPVCGGPDGRPVLDQPAPRPEFSISRTEGLALLGIASVPIGVDVQALPGPEVSEDVSALLHPAEQLELGDLELARRPAAFTRMWTRKEAYLKGIGAGIAHELTADYLGTENRATAPPGWNILDASLPGGYSGAVAIRCD